MARVLTLNVHDPEVGTLPSIAAFLESSGAGLIGLTECPRPAFDALAELLACAAAVHAPAPCYGNGLLVRSLPVRGSRAVLLKPEHTWERRSAAVAEVSIAGRWQTCVVTHLDHTSEDERQQQFAQLENAVDLSDALLLGDLNSLCRRDHDDATWKTIAARRRAAGVEPLPFRLADALLDEGFRDAALAARDARPTSRYGVRVDYLLLGPDSPLDFVPGSYDVLPAMDAGLTDHDAPCVDLEAGG